MTNQQNYIVCQTCGKELFQKNKKYCSVKCLSVSGCNSLIKITIERIKNYNLNPKLCRFCGNSLIYSKRNNTFCNHSCSAKFNNLGIVRNGESPKICISCRRRFYNRDDTKQRCIKCEIKFNITNNIQVTDGSLRTYLIKTRGYKCEECKNTEWNGEPIPIDLHHLDGNEHNNVVSNGQLLCKNCHAQTDTYGRKKRRKISSK